MEGVMVVATIFPKSSRIISVEYPDATKKTIALRVGAETVKLTKDETSMLIDTLTAYRNGFVFPPQSGLKIPDDKHESFPEG